MTPHYNERPSGTRIDTIVIHSMHVPGSRRPYDPRECARTLEEAKVSAHYLIGRHGEIVKLVEESLRAWHAGVSKMPFADDPREGVNDFSIGIELLGDPAKRFTKAQYRALGRLCAGLARRYPIRAVVGHDHIAPGRKVDPGSGFRWGRLAKMMRDRLEKTHFGRLRIGAP